jgi:hypothetical protein
MEEGSWTFVRLSQKYYCSICLELVVWAHGTASANTSNIWLSYPKLRSALQISLLHNILDLYELVMTPTLMHTYLIVAILSLKGSNSSEFVVLCATIVPLYMHKVILIAVITCFGCGSDVRDSGRIYFLANESSR